MRKTRKTEDKTFIDWHLRREDRTAGFRDEFKIVVPKKTAREFVLRVRERFGPLLARDVLPPGFEMLNRTDYLDVRPEDLLGALGYSKPLPRQSPSPKLRVRKYGLRNCMVGIVDLASITEKASFVEIKMPHPSHATVALKSRILIEDALLPRLLSRGAMAKASTQRKLLRALISQRSNERSTAERFLKLFADLHQRQANFRSTVRTEYIRAAYRLSARASGARVDVQITMDRGVTYYDPGSGERIAKHKKQWRVVEIKLPIEVAGWSPQVLAKRGLGSIATLQKLKRTLLQPNRVKEVRLGDGKKAYVRRANTNR